MQHEVWDTESIHALYQLPFLELVYRAYKVHRTYFDATEMELCTLLSIKTGTCPEDCAYCPQSAHYKTGLQKENLLPLETVIQHARQAKAQGAHRFCMGAAWRSPPKKELPKVVEMIKQVKALGLETCCCLGMLDTEQAMALKEAGLDFYNHNLDTSPDFYKKIITTRDYQDRLDTLARVRQADIKVCCGGILGMGETREDRIQFIVQLKALPSAPQSITLNQLIPIRGTPLERVSPLDSFEFIRTIAIVRLLFPSSTLRLSAGRESMSDEMQAWCFMAGANSIFYGDLLLTATNPSVRHDLDLLEKLGFHATTKPSVHEVHADG